MEITLNTQGRVFILADNKKFTYYNAMSVGPVDKTLPAFEDILTYNNGKVVKIARMSDEIGQITSSLTGYLPIGNKSNLEKILTKENIHMQVHFGQCSRPNDFNTFESALILRGVTLTNYNTTEVAAMTPTRTAIQESANITIENSYRVFNLDYNDLYLDSVMMGMDIIDLRSCTVENNENCLVALRDDGTTTYMVYSTDNGLTWQENPTLFPEHDSSPERSALVTHKDKIFFSIYADNVSYLYVSEADSILKNEETPYALLASKANTPIRGLTTSERYLWGVGGSGSSYVFRMSYSDYIVTALDNNEFFSNYTLNAIDAFNDNIALAVGFDSIYGLYRDGNFFVDFIPFDGSASLTDVKMLSETHWVVCSDFGVYITLNGGDTWSKSLSVNEGGKLTFYDDITGYFVTPSNVYRTLDGGRNWLSVKYHFTPLYQITSLVMDPKDANSIFFTGLFYIMSGAKL